jgi:hypothetical protein
MICKVKAGRRDTKIHKFNSLKDYELTNLMVDQLAGIKGSFEADGVVGQIRLSTFHLSIKSLVSDYQYSKNVLMGDWQALCGFMKK